MYLSLFFSSFFFIQFYDLQQLFRSGGEIPDVSYVFMVSALGGCGFLSSPAMWLF